MSDGKSKDDDLEARCKKLNEALDELAEGGALIEQVEGLETLLVYAKNLILFPEEKKYRKVKVGNVHFQERLGHLKGSHAAMHAIGYALNGDYLRLDEQKVKAGDTSRSACLKELEKVLSGRLSAARKRFEEMPVRLPPQHTFSSVKAAGHHSEIGKRNTMEDDEILVDEFAGDAKAGFFGLYDGHGGRATVNFVVRTLHDNLQQNLKMHPDRVFSENFTMAYLATDGQLRRQNILRSGSTAVTCVVRENEKGQRMLHVANVGDSRAVLIRNGEAVRLTIDHKASLPEEAKRVTDAGGFIGRNKRVNGVLAISRALGDHMLKENDVVTAVPHTMELELTPQDSYLIMACDGLWDVMTDQEACKVVMTLAQRGEAEGVENRNVLLSAIAKALVQEALDRRSLDNITAMVVQLN